MCPENENEPVGPPFEVEGHLFPPYQVDREVQMGRCLRCRKYPGEVAHGRGVFAPCESQEQEQGEAR